MPKFRDLTGCKFGRWTVLYWKETKYTEHIWVCRCECGTEKEVIGGTLKSGKSKSCGCFSRELTTKHGMEGTATYNTWASMLTRCRNKKHACYESYGGRGISVCDAWIQFENFYADMGDKPEGMSLDRINNDGNYEPSNCRWATQKTQSRNRTISPRYEVNGEMVSLADLAEKHGMNWRRVYERMRQGWNLYRALTTPVRPKKLKGEL